MSRRRHTGSAAQALRVVTELSASASAPLTGLSPGGAYSPHAAVQLDSAQYDAPYDPPSFHATAFPFPPPPGPNPPAPYADSVRRASGGPLPLPVPVPNLIKKSRGRAVPADTTSGPPRTFVCGVAGCEKGFVRGEHLKRHVRSIHTYEKPHKCPFEGCDKAFSRRDNLAQHARMHLPTNEDGPQL
ncbi:hypothetical protein B0H15DRAFT_780496 [Mycena belliarum]|uniref:C2H2-type domain-containing protein n=1 Tax=Mycena belliarum TaxID=1033014 RepID=A0AAD6U6L7_9AGAR|nr:hypothetical protein B0H15DRAFT_780496 [Mycena belliae]